MQNVFVLNVCFCYDMYLVTKTVNKPKGAKIMLENKKIERDFDYLITSKKYMVDSYSFLNSICIDDYDDEMVLKLNRIKEDLKSCINGLGIIFFDFYKLENE